VGGTVDRGPASTDPADQQQLAAIDDLKAKVADLQNQLDEAKKEEQKLKDAQAAGKPGYLQSGLARRSPSTVAFCWHLLVRSSGTYPNWSTTYLMRG